ncbi:MAG: Putative cell division protein FtsQ [Anaerolinea thermophila]|uniref:Putative cell division protein FtsQ n=1 Tax=Anaerolinea thermophila TaxID=167964 RepID=A0A101FWK7_9CHLR|nr:MAG: Putative cell division protein FtsQ [Anaerolinea thermophila]
MAKRQREDESRFEKIRAYRQTGRKNTPQSPYVSSATRKQTKRKVPVTRRTMPSPPMVKRQGRKVNVPLRTKGAELQLPAFPQLQLGWRFISGAIFFLSLAVVFSFASLDAFEITSINLNGSHRLGAEAILSQVDLVGKAIISVKPEVVKQEITESFPSVKSVKVSAGLPASVNIQVVERDPIILWQSEEMPLWIDAEGVTFPVRGEAETILTVLANGNPPEIAEIEETETDEENEEIASFLEPRYPKTTLEFIHGMLALSEYLPEDTYFQYDPQFGLGWQDPRGWLVYFGSNTSEIDIKLAEYETIISTLQAENRQPALISLEFLHAPFYRMEP